ncbi:MAG: CoA-binding protein [Chloroflexi bacterium]|nr:CoA-binding protein [Chloroflexota bacterium]
MDSVSLVKQILEPRSVALVGLPRDAGPESRNVMEYLLRHGYEGRIFPVNPNCPEILGVKTYCSVRDLPETPDLAVIATPQHLALSLVQESAEKGIKAIAVVAQGFADADAEGGKRQQEIVSVAHRYGARVLGPNTFGAANAFLNFNTAFALTPMRRVPIGMICQSGFPFAGFPRMVVVGKALDIGNTSDVDFSDGLEYFAGDDQTRLVALYVEGIRDGRRFMETAQRVTARKPVIALKAGKGVSGARVASSHSGSLTGVDRVYDAAFKQCGVLRVEDTEELVDLCRAFLALPKSRVRRLGVLTMTMAGGTMVADACEKYNMKLPAFSEDTVRKVAALAPPWLRIGNPLDQGAVNFSGAGPRKAIRVSLEAVLEDPAIDAVLVIIPALEPEHRNFRDVALEMAARYGEKPVAFWIYGPDFDGSTAADLESTGRIVNFGSLDRAVRALSRMAKYAEYVETRNDE